jgi:hypothetical protein
MSGRSGTLGGRLSCRNLGLLPCEVIVCLRAANVPKPSSILSIVLNGCCDIFTQFNSRHCAITLAAPVSDLNHPDIF